MDEWNGWRLDEVDGGCMKQVMDGWNGSWMVNG